MTVAPFGTAAFAAQRSSDLFQTTRRDLSAAQSQLSTGKVATTYAGLGAAAGPSVLLRTKLGALDAYAANIQDGTVRIGIMDAALTQIGNVSRDLGSIGRSAVGGSTDGVAKAEVIARTGLDTIVEALNSQVNGRYLFAGRAADTQPVVSAGLLLDGDATHAGLRTLIAERKAADSGSDGMGRLVLSAAGPNVTLAEEAAGLPFGAKLSSASATGTGVTAAVSGTPAAAQIAVTSQPAPGDSVALTLALPDGTEKVVTLTAGPAPTGSSATFFAIGATPADTAANIAAVLTGAVQKTVAEDLASASATATARDFFAADSASPPTRVVGPPFATATATAPGTAGNTVIWYAGDSFSSPRDTAPVRVGDGRQVGIGAAANESLFQNVLASVAVLAAESFAGSDPSAKGRYDALSDRVATTLSAPSGRQSLPGISADLAIASATLKAASKEISVTKAQVADTLAGLEDADPNEAAMKLMATQTRLQASYQTTATLQKLSLVNYL